MAKRDYGTGRSTQKSVLSKPNRVARSVFPNYLLFFLAGVLLTLLGIFFWLKKSGSTSSRPARQPAALKKLPSKPQERWRYIKALENKEVIVPIVPPSSAKLKDSNASLTLPKPLLPSFKVTQWWLYCEPLKSSESLQSLRAHLALLGFEGTMIKENKRSQLALGPYTHRQLAGKHLQQLKHHQITCCTLNGS
ncbi:MAG: SPOR domain-containing protein [Candidatus Symbiodolus clandestinus]